MGLLSKILFRQKNNQQRLYIIVFFGVLVLGLLPLIYQLSKNPNQAEASWFDESFGIRQPFSFTHNANINDKRAITFSLDTAELITDGVMQSDCDDIRFTDSTGKELEYDLTGTCNNIATTFEVIFESINNGSNLGYAYYNNPNATNQEIDSTVYTALTPNGGDPSITTRTKEEKSPGPVAYWKFDEGTDNTCTGGTNDVCDSTTQGNDGAFTNAPIWETEDKCLNGKCLLFDGLADDYISIPASNLPTTDFTYSFWFKHTASASNDAILYANDGTNLDEIQVRVESDEKLTFKIDNTTELQTTSNIVQGKWYHAAYTRTGSDIKLYLNGVEEASGTDGTALNFGSCSLIVGLVDDNATCAVDSAAGRWVGFLDELKIYNYARSADEVKADFIKGAGGAGSAAVLGAQDNAFLNDGLVGYWPMDDGGTGNGLTMTDESGNGSDGTTDYGANTTGMDCSVAGKFGLSCDFDDTDDDIDISTSTYYELNENLTVSAWVNADTIDGDEAIFDITNNNAGYRLQIESDSSPAFRTGNGTSYDDDKSATATLSTNTWHHVTATLSNGTVKRIYLDGELVHEVSRTVALVSSRPPDIGGRSNTTVFDGSIDEVRVYNRALSPAEVKKLYEWAPGPVGYWPMDKNIGTTSYDKSGNGNNGTLQSSMTASDWVTGKYGAALDFDGTDDNISLGNPAELQGTGSHTISAWLNISQLATDKGSQHSCVIKGTGSGWGFLIGQAFVTATDYWWASVVTTTPSAVQYQVTAGTPNINEWHHVSAVFDNPNSLLTLYVDGAAIGSVSTGTNLRYSNSSLIGQGASNDNRCKGKIDEVKIYNYARTPSQIIEDMNGGHPIGGSPVGSQLAYWKFDEQYGQTAYNTVSSSLPAVLGTSTGDTSRDPTWRVKGQCKINGCLEFDGTDDKVEPDQPGSGDLDLTGDMTITTWINADTIADQETIIYQGEQGSETEADNELYFLRWDTTSGNDLEYGHENSTGTDNYNVFDTNLSTATWYHVAFTRDATANEVDLYVDGTLIDTYSYSNDPTGGAGGETAIGSHDNNGDFFDGKIDDFKIYSAALTADEILVDMNANSANNFGTGTNEDADLNDGALPAPIGYWDFNENEGTTVYDKSTNSDDGTLTNAASTNASWRPGKYGSSLYFDGVNDYVETSDSSQTDFANGTDFTVSLWAKPDLVGTDVMIAKKSSDGSTSGFWIQHNSSGNVSVHIADEHGDEYDLGTTTDTISTDQWNHIVLVFDDDSTTNTDIYLNGIKQGTTPTGILANMDCIGCNSSQEIFFAEESDADSGGSQNPYAGHLDEIKIFNVALTPAQIAYEYNRGMPLYHFKFDECQGTTINNTGSVGSILNGTLTIGGSETTYTSAGTCNSGTATEAWNGGTTGKLNYSIALSNDTGGGNDTVVDDYILVPNSSLPTGTGDYTVTVWAYQTDDDSGGDNDFIFLAPDNSDGRELGLMFVNPGSSTTHVRGYINGGAITSDTEVFNNTWYHIAFVRSGSTVSLYIDGKLDNTGTNSNSLNYGTCTDFVIGADHDTGADCTPDNQAWTGQLDDFRIYHYPLTANQIRKVMLGGEAGSAVKFAPNEGAP